jgi:hypothetical protein
MPVTSSGKWYQGVVGLPGASIGPKVYGSTTTETAFAVEDAFSLEAQVGAHSFYRTSLTGTNNDLDIIAKAPGDLSALQFRIVNGGNSQSLSVAYTTNLVTVNVATTSGGVITSTAAQVLAAINAADSAAAPYVVANLTTGNDGTGLVTALSAQSLVNSSGTSPTADVTMTASVDGSTDYANILTVPQITTARAYYKRLTNHVSANGTMTAKWTVTIGGSATPLLALSLRANKVTAFS